ncbi:anion permease [Fusibacter paucivorans]|uniref:Anion permease n=1 Tax=Fusibacter paucivorans TaxID=76009 RepID=A0ABS5PNJ4_9FIRM|nr:anion permease [Fusibacter paucivorans]MBS7526738.1 anion permease [Fusibacter paucivorans]
MSRNTKNLLLSFIAPILILMLKPLGITLAQSIVLSTLIFTITVWVNNAIHKSAASVIALILFYWFGHPALPKLLQFPLSENFILIVFSFVFSQGIANSGLAELLIEPFLIRNAKTKYKLLAIIYLLAFIMIFVIPQPFSRVIILSHIFYQYFNKMQLDKGVQNVLMFAVFLFSMFINMTMIRGDIILNNALLTMSNQPITELTWIKWMALPSLIYCILALLLFSKIFHNELLSYQHKAGTISHKTKVSLSPQNKKHLIAILIILIAWATEDLHGISGTYVVTLGTLAMIPLGLVNKSDSKAINIHLLIFLTAAFAIGPVMTASGLADVLFSRFTAFFPAQFNTLYATVILAVTTVLHMILGSNVTTMSVVIPGLMTTSSGIASPIVIMFLIFIAVCGHIILPFHNVIILLGNGSGYYENKTVIKYGIALLPLMLLSALFVYLPWWRFMT